MGALAERLCELGATVYTCGREDCPPGCSRADEPTAALEGAMALILPIPSFVEERYVYGMQTPLSAEELFDRVGRSCPVFGARLSPAIRSRAAQAGVRLIDYAALEEVQLRNAVPTAEGALYLAMQALDITLDGARAAVIGYGRIGRVLARLLRALGADVTVAVRKSTDAVRIATEHLTPLQIVYEGEDSSLLAVCRGYDVIFNTVPCRLFSQRLLAALPRTTLLMELASAPGGWDPDDAAAVGARVIYAPGLPGKYAPRTAGKLLADSLLPYLQREVHRV